MYTLAFFNSIGPMEVVFLLVLGILVFGKKLPDIGRNVGKSIVEFKKGLAGVDEDVNTAANTPRAGNTGPGQQQQYQPYQQHAPQNYQQPPQYPQAQQYQQPPQQITGQPQQPTMDARQASQSDQANRQA